MTISVVVHGATGRSGSLVVKLLSEDKGCSLRAAVVSPYSKNLGLAVPGHSHLTYSADVASAAADADLCIDFSEPAAAVSAARVCAEFSIPIVIATTGFSVDQVGEIETFAKSSPILLTSNTSLGVAVLRAIALNAQRLLGDDFQIEILDIHHRHKKDSPSGTAKSLASDLSDAGALRIVNDRSATMAPRADSELGVVGLRGGDVVGEHTIYFFGEGERLELTHRATNREIFARGAISLGRKLCEMPPGLYSVQELISAKLQG